MAFHAAQSDPTTYLCPGGCHSSRGSDIIETADDAEITSGPCDGDGELNAGGYRESVRDKNHLKECSNVPISHHTGAQLMAFPFHKMESTK